MPVQTRSKAKSKGVDTHFELVQGLQDEIARLRKQLATANRRITREQATSGALAARLNTAPRPATPSKRTSSPSTPLWSRRSKSKSRSPPGGISKIPPRSRSKSRSPRQASVDKRVSSPSTPLWSRGSTRESGFPPGDISKTPPLSWGKSRSPTPADVEKGTGASSTPLGPRASTRESGSPSGGISKTPPCSKSKSRSPSPPEEDLVKRNGRRVHNNQVIIPQRVLDGPAVHRFPHLDSPRSKGLWNKGNFCYRNALLQALFHVPAFYRYMGKTHKNCKLPRVKCVVCALQDLAHVYWNDDTVMRSIDGGLPGPYDAIRRLNFAVLANLPGSPNASGVVMPGLGEQRRDYEQEAQSDTWEFLVYLLGHIRGEEKPRDDIPSGDVFRFSTESKWTCNGCGTTSTTHEADLTGINLYISLPKTGLTLVEYLNEHFTENLDISCKKDLPECNGTSAMKEAQISPTRKRTTRIDQAPQILMICLNRFSGRMVGNEFVANKITNDVPFEEYLNMGPFTTDGNDLMYRLDGVVAHVGQTIEFGHYIASFRNHTGQGFQTASDDTFLGTSARGRGTFLEMQYPGRGKEKAHPFVLFYSKM